MVSTDKKDNMIILVIIPAYEPDDRLTELLDNLNKSNISPIILVDDGSGDKYRHYFDEAEEKFKCIILRHAVNLGKGRALKDAFNYCLNTYKTQLLGCITADSDGQHTPVCIQKCREELKNSPNGLILGVRDFNEDNIPPKSRYGNKLTCGICRLLCGVTVSDTQTGLRGIPVGYMKELLGEIPGERFEFETRMLIAAKDRFPIIEVPIKTVYDSCECHTTHFDPIKDSIRIYRIFGSMFVKFLFSSLSSSVIDLLMFSIFCGLFSGYMGTVYVAAATVAARIISAGYNYLINYSVVFKSKVDHKHAFIHYFTLAAVQMCCSAVIVTGILFLLPTTSELAVKIPVDVILFFISYTIQRELVYK